MSLPRRALHVWHPDELAQICLLDVTYGDFPMFLLVLTLAIAVAVAVVVTAFAAFPHRGEPIPHAERLSEAMIRLNDKIGL